MVAQSIAHMDRNVAVVPMNDIASRHSTMPIGGDWSIEERNADPGAATEWLYRQPSLNVGLGPAGVFCLEFPGFVTFDVNPEERTIAIGAGVEANAETISHFLYDQVFPRIIAQNEFLVLHSAAVSSESGAILFIGPTGAGKSTLAASLHLAGFALIGDDAIIVRRNGSGHVAEAVYRSLRLNPDALTALGGPWSHRAMAQYSDKRRVEQAELGDVLPPQPIAAIVVLSVGQDVHLSRLSNVDACMSVAEHSFWLDPSDVGQTCKRLTAACEVVAATPVYRLSFRRDFADLPAIHNQLSTLLGPFAR